MNPASSIDSKMISVTFINEVEAADVWILPQTEENLKTSLWGAPSFSKMSIGGSDTCVVNCASTGRYIVRIIDADGAYYAANDLVLDDHYTVRFETQGSKYEAAVVTLDDRGDRSAITENVFKGVLGAD